MRIATYNIHDGIGLDGRFDLDRLTTVIRASGADIIGIQEVPRYLRNANSLDSMRVFAEAVDMYGAFSPSYTMGNSAPVGSWEGRALDWPQFGNGLLSRYPIQWSESHPLPYLEMPGAYLERRGILEASINGPDGRFLVFVTHLGLDVAERIRQIQELILRVDRSRGPLLLLGDFNSEPNSEPITMLESHLACIPADGLGFTFPMPNPTQRLDYLFVRGFNVVGDATTLADPASDHLLVTGQVEMSAEPWPNC